MAHDTSRPPLRPFMEAARALEAGTVIEVDTPGLTAVNPESLAYRYVRRSLYPLG
jgi:hypothetical protein